MNPYRQVRRTLRRRRPRSLGPLLPLLAFAVATPLVRRTLLPFLDGGSLPAGIEALSFRLGALVAGAMALYTYTDLVRSPERAVLDPHPVRARELVTAVALDTARERLYLPLGGAILLLPVALEGEWLAWAGGSAVVLGAWLCSLGIGYTVHLGAVWAAWSPGLAKLLDLLRGDNPRLQAALIYAPGVALAVAGLAVALASAGVRLALEGSPWGWSFLVLPLVVGAVGWALVGGLAERWYVRATALLAEIDAQYAQHDAAEEERHVYLDWLARGRPELLRALRQGWRLRRTWATGAWGLGILGLAAAWTPEPTAALRTVAVAGASVALLGALPARLAEGDPPWLDAMLGVRPGPVLRARLLTAFLYAQGAILVPVAALLVRHGTVSFLVLAILELLALGGAAAGAWAASRWRERGVLAYGPLAVVVWALVVWSVQTGGLA